MAKRPVGRPNTGKEKITDDQVYELAKIGATDAQIALALKIPESTLQNNFQAVLKDGRNGLILKGKRKLYVMGIEGDSMPALGMLLRIMIPKEINNHLYDDETGKKIKPFETISLSPEQLLELGKKLREPKSE